MHIKIFDGDGKTREERETCFPAPNKQKIIKTSGQVRDDG